MTYGVSWLRRRQRYYVRSVSGSWELLPWIGRRWCEKAATKTAKRTHKKQRTHKKHITNKHITCFRKWCGYSYSSMIIMLPTKKKKNEMSISFSIHFMHWKLALITESFGETRPRTHVMPQTAVHNRFLSFLAFYTEHCCRFCPLNKLHPSIERIVGWNKCRLGRFLTSLAHTSR